MNLFAGVPAELPDELIETIVRSDAVRIERIVSRGHASPPGFWYDQDENEWVVVLAGSAEVEFADGQTARLGPGDWVEIAARRRHRVARTDPDRDTVWLAVFWR